MMFRISPRRHVLNELCQAEAIARKINLILGDTRESLAEKTGR